MGGEVDDPEVGVDRFHQLVDFRVRDAVTHEGEGDFVDDLRTGEDAAVGLEFADQLL